MSKFQRAVLAWTVLGLCVTAIIFLTTGALTHAPLFIAAGIVMLLTGIANVPLLITLGKLPGAKKKSLDQPADKWSALSPTSADDVKSLKP
jgi:hypothetical protein